MHFAYEGFTHQGGKRFFQFRKIGPGEPVLLFTIEVDVVLLSTNKLSIQEAPLFCLKMLEATLVSDPDALQGFRAYQLVAEDFRILNAERARREAELRLRKYAARPRRPVGSALPASLFGAKVTHAV